MSSKRAASALIAIGCVVGLGCSDPAQPATDADTRPDAPLVTIDAGPKTYEQAADFLREGCDDNDSLADLAILGKWHNVPTSGDEEFDSYFLEEEGALKGILDLIPADLIEVDGNNLFLHRRLNLSSLAVNLCAIVDSDTLFGHMAKCNGQDCSVDTLTATLVEPSTQ